MTEIKSLREKLRDRIFHWSKRNNVLPAYGWNLLFKRLKSVYPGSFPVIVGPVKQDSRRIIDIIEEKGLLKEALDIAQTVLR